MQSSTTFSCFDKIFLEKVKKDGVFYGKSLLVRGIYTVSNNQSMTFIFCIPL